MTEVQHRFLFGLRTFVIIATIAAIVLAAYAYCRWSMEQFLHVVFVGDTGPVTSRDDWPEPLKALIHESDNIEIDESTIQVHCLCQGFDPNTFGEWMGCLVCLNTYPIAGNSRRSITRSGTC